MSEAKHVIDSLLTYYCTKCKGNHYYDSEVGKKHLTYLKTPRASLLEKVEKMKGQKLRADSKTIGEWISCCMHKHGPKGDGSMTHQQCIAAAYKALGKSKKDFLRIVSGLDLIPVVVKGDLTLKPVISRTHQRDLIPFSEFHQLKTDFTTEDFVIFHGPIARDGGYDYYDENGNLKTLYKDINNLEDIYSRYDYLPLKASEELAHYASEFGYATNFMRNNELNQIEADLVLVNDDTFKRILGKKEEYHVSPGYNDIIEGNIQIITDLDHVALSLGDEMGRACTGVNEKGVSCTKVKPIQINHDQNQLQEVI